jgi:hypothetical protein
MWMPELIKCKFIPFCHWIVGTVHLAYAHKNKSQSWNKIWQHQNSSYFQHDTSFIKIAGDCTWYWLSRMSSCSGQIDILKFSSKAGIAFNCYFEHKDAFSFYVDIVQFWLKFNNNNGCFTWRPMCFYVCRSFINFLPTKLPTYSQRSKT